MQTQKNGKNLAGQGQLWGIPALIRDSFCVYSILYDPENNRFLTADALICSADWSGEKMRVFGRTAITAAAMLAGLLPAGMAPVQVLAQPAASSSTLQTPGLQIIGAARPPFISEGEGGTGTGPAAELVQELARATGMAPVVRILPFQRAVMALDQGGTLYPALLRTPQRESRYIWIGEVFTDRAAFHTRRGTPVINTLDAARQLGRINVMRGSELQSMLQSFSVPDIEPSNSEVDIARLLNAGRIDGWFGPRAVARATWAGLGFDPADLQSGETFATLPFWITASLDTPGETVARLRTAYRAMVQDGRYRRIVTPLRVLESPS